MCPQRVAHEPDHLREPVVIDLKAEFSSDHLGDLILKPLFLFIREGQVVWIGANLQLTAVDNVVGLRSRGSGRNEKQARHLERARKAHLITDPRWTAAA